MIKTKETTHHDYYLVFIDTKPVKIMLDKTTGDVLLDADHIATLLGYESTAAMMADEYLPAVIDAYKKRFGQYMPSAVPALVP